MKKISLILMSLVVTMGLFSQTKPKVQGIEHDGLRNAKIVTALKPSVEARNLRNSTSNINFGDIDFWVGSGTDSAALVIKWNDGKGSVNALVWGYKFSGTKTSKDMLVAVANADPRFSVLMQNTGISPATGDTLNYAIAGIGYNHAASSRVSIQYDLTGAESDTRISFHFVAPPNTAMGQTHVPATPQADADAAIAAGTASGTGAGKGVIEHPFNYAVYGYPAYDYDWWIQNNPTTNRSWRAGWYDGYWSFYVKSSPSGTWGYSMVGASQRVLSNGYVDGWSFCDDMETWYCADMSGEYTPAPAP